MTFPFTFAVRKLQPLRAAKLSGQRWQFAEPFSKQLQRARWKFNFAEKGRDEEELSQKIAGSSTSARQSCPGQTPREAEEQIWTRQAKTKIALFCEMFSNHVCSLLPLDGLS